MSMRRRHLPQISGYENDHIHVWQEKYLCALITRILRLGNIIAAIFPDLALPSQPALCRNQWFGFDIACAHAALLDRPDKAHIL